MKNIYFATRVRGFFVHLFNSKNIKYKFTTNDNSIYQLNSKKRKILQGIVKSRLLDFIGIIQVINCKNKDGDIYGSFNRFLNADKPYFIYVENPTALYHYKLNRNKSLIGKYIIKRNLKNDNLKAIICMSYACLNTFEKVCGETGESVIEKRVIYPLVPKNKYVNQMRIIDRVKSEKVQLLFIAQGIRFVSKGALEVIEAYKKIKLECNNIELTMITSIDDVDKSIIDGIYRDTDIKLLDFKLSYDEMENIYANSSLLLQPTSDDSTSLTILEGMKAGLPVLASKLYSIPEFVKEGRNGYLVDPQWWFFDENNIPNPKVWNNRNTTIYSKVVDNNIVNFLYEKIKLFDNDRGLLERMSLNSYEIANSDPFSEECISNAWNEVLDKLATLSDK